MVSIDGTFPSMVSVWFGDQPGELVHHSSNWIIVVAPTRSQAGPVDVTLRSNSAGTVLLARDAFTYVDPNGGSTTTTTTPTTPTTTGSTTSTTTSPGGGGPTPTTTPGGGQSTTTTSGDGGGGSGGGGGTTSTTGGDEGQNDGGVTTTTTSGATTTEGSGPTTTTSATSTTESGGQPTTTEPPGLPRRSRSQASGQPIDLGGGLQGVPLQGLGGLGDIAACVSEPCRSRRI